MTTRPLFILQAAEADLWELRDHLRRQFGTQAWDESYAKIRLAIARIADHPQAGKLPHELAELNLDQFRQSMAGMNRIIYELRDDAIYIHLICDARRDLRSLLMRRLLHATSPG